MCGIIAIVGRDRGAPLPVDAPRRPAYRGCDSAGNATLVNGRIDRCRAEGKLRNPAARLEAEPIAGTTGIGHTRWATHGRSGETNAHPHANAHVAVVHGIVENLNEQPSAIGDTRHAFPNPLRRGVTLPELPFDPGRLPRVTITACGTAFPAGWVAKYWMEQVARQPVELDVASELRYRAPPTPDGGLTAVISQSGETAETHGALRYAREQGQRTLSIVNVAESAIARDGDAVLQTPAGPEIGVASTKAFATRLTVLGALSVAIGRARGTIDRETAGHLTDALIEVPAQASGVPNHDGHIQEIGQWVAAARDVPYLGRGNLYPIALEGALKLKEISSIHAEGYAAGEMKHGPIAPIDAHVPVICCAPSGPPFPKMAGNVQEVIARGGRVIPISDRQGVERAGQGADYPIDPPEADPFVAPPLHALPVQLPACHTAPVKGPDVDRPGNPAKSVTVE